VDAVIRLVLFASITCQLSVTILALHLIRITGEKRSWALIAVASALMAARPGFVLLEWLFGKAHRLPDIWSELISLVISVLLLTGISHISVVILSLKRSREELIEREERVAAMVDNAADAFFVYDGAGRIIEASRNAWTTLGYSRSELLSLFLADIEKRKDPGDLLAQCSQMPPGTSLAVEGVHQRKDGSTFPVEIHLGTFESAGQKQYLALVHDSTERKQAEEALQKSEARYKSLVAAVTDYIYTVEVREGQAVKTVHGAGCIAVTGYTPEEYEADPLLWYRMIVADDRDTVVAQAARVITGEAVPLEHRIVHKDGTMRWVKNTPVPRYDEHGVLLAYDGLITDITELKRAEEELRLKSAALEAAANAVMITGRDGRIVWVNPAFTHLTGYSFDEAVNLTPQILMSGLQRKPFYRNLWNTILGGEVWHGELINRRKSGISYYEEETITPVKDERGEIRYFVAIKQDISERKKAEKELLENATIRRDMKIARQIQRSFLPTRPPAIPGVQLAGRCVPAAHVGGDYYDFFTLEEGILDVVIADVTGHSVGSALLMAEARSVLHATIHPRSSPGEILSSLNDLLHEDLERAELLISMFYLKLDAATLHYAFANAGHIQPLLFRHGDASFLELDAEGLLLGVLRGFPFEEKTGRVEPGDIIALYTDGIPEAQNHTGDFFGRVRLGEVIAERHEDPPEAIAEAIFNALTAFAGTKPLEDDTSLVIIKIA
jgi:sigma-B regulation protein RsbU (phosphoserine phosphatase)